MSPRQTDLDPRIEKLIFYALTAYKCGYWGLEVLKDPEIKTILAEYFSSDGKKYKSNQNYYAEVSSYFNRLKIIGEGICETLGVNPAPKPAIDPKGWKYE